MFLRRLNELPQAMADFIRFAGRIADDKAVNVYVVGGFVRDLFLKVDNFDVDLVVDGDGIAFAKECAHKLNLKLVTHKRFGTATLLGLDGFKVDITSSRREIYEKPAALPVVFSGTIKDDLLRRDFTINAIVISINKHNFGKVMDFYDGQSDLKNKLVRALHSLSFIDDPTRILRAVRFEQRFGFEIEKSTLSWIKDAKAKKMLDVVQKHRLRDELILIFKEKIPVKPLKRLESICGFSYIAKGLRFKKDWNVIFAQVYKKAQWFKEKFSHKRHLELYVMYMSLFFYHLPLGEIRKVIADFAFHKGESLRVLSLKEDFSKIKNELSKKNLKPSAVYRLLEPVSYEVLLLAVILSKNKLVEKRIDDFLFIYNGQRIHIRGEDLKKAGIKPGPQYKKFLLEILYAKIDGKANTKEDELELLGKFANNQERAN